MIARPNDWETAQAYTGEVMEQLTPGGHVIRILGMRQEMSQKTNKPMLVVSFDVEEGSSFDGYYKRMHESKKKFDAGAKWNGVIRYMLYNKEGGTNGFFKGFIGAVEESNPGYKWNWDERGIAGKLVGMVFGEEEYRKQDGSIGTSVKAQMARSVKAVRDGEVEVPEKKTLKETPTAYAPYDPSAGFTAAEGPLPWET